MTSVGEASRLYQAALEEHRLVRSRAHELIPGEAVDALEHMAGEVRRSRRALSIAWVERAVTR